MAKGDSHSYKNKLKKCSIGTRKNVKRCKETTKFQCTRRILDVSRRDGKRNMYEVEKYENKLWREWRYWNWNERKEDKRIAGIVPKRMLKMWKENLMKDMLVDIRKMCGIRWMKNFQNIQIRLKRIANAYTQHWMMSDTKWWCSNHKRPSLTIVTIFILKIFK